MTPIAGILRRKPPAPRRAGRVGEHHLINRAYRENAGALPNPTCETDETDIVELARGLAAT
jgi:hypothetical protein